jgi:hypothetical protein
MGSRTVAALQDQRNSPEVVRLDGQDPRNFTKVVGLDGQDLRNFTVVVVKTRAEGTTSVKLRRS